MTHDDIAFLTLGDAARRIDLLSLSPLDLVDACLDRIRAHDGVVHSFLHLDTEAGRQAARHATRSPRSGSLHGIPLGIKDLFDTIDMPTTANSRVFQNRRATDDAGAVKNLRDAGAIVLGKLAAWECGIGGTSFDLPWPPARNPWSLDRDPGGSSTGAGVAVASGFCFGALGSDTGGSIREPAAWCGVAGLKPTCGLVPLQGAMAASSSLDHAGPIARTSEDCAWLLEALSGRKPGEMSAGLSDGVAGLNIGVVELAAREAQFLDADVATNVQQTAAVFEKLGARVVSAKIPPLQHFNAAVTVIAGVEGFAQHRNTLESSRDDYDPLTLQRLLAGASIADSDYMAALDFRRRLTRQIDEVFTQYDLLMMPTVYRPAPLLGQYDSHGGHPSLTRPWNVTGVPALSVRSGFTAAGLPLAVQIIGRRREDQLVLQAGHALETALSLGGIRPRFSGLPTVPKQASRDDALLPSIRSAIETIRSHEGGD